METNLIYIFIALMFGWYNGVFNSWGLEINHNRKAQLSSIWHLQGWIIRAALALVVTIQSGLFWGWIMVIALWHCFDIIINLTRKQKWYYSGSVAVFDRYSTITWIAKGLWLAGGAYFIWN